MTQYRGVQQKDILESLHLAEEFIRRADMGPTVTTMYDNWLALDPFKNIAEAKDDAALALALENNRAGVFAGMKEIIAYHAKKDLAAGGGEALELYKSLSNWDALGRDDWTRDLLVPGLVNKDYDFDDEEHGRQIDDLRKVTDDLLREKNAYMIVQYAKELATADIVPQSPFMQRFGDAVETRKKNMINGNRMAPQLLSLMPLLVKTLATSGEIVARALVMAKEKDFSGFDIFLKEVLEKSLPVDQSTTTLDSVTRFNMYGIKAEGRFMFSELPEMFAADVSKIEGVLKPFKDRGEVISSGTGMITAEPENDLKYASWGYCIRATREAAQALAEAFPDRKVIDHTATQIILHAVRPKPGQQFKI